MIASRTEDVTVFRMISFPPFELNFPDHIKQDVSLTVTTWLVFFILKLILSLFALEPD